MQSVLAIKAAVCLLALSVQFNSLLLLSTLDDCRRQLADRRQTGRPPLKKNKKKPHAAKRLIPFSKSERTQIEICATVRLAAVREPRARLLHSGGTFQYPPLPPPAPFPSPLTPNNGANQLSGSWLIKR